MTGESQASLSFAGAIRNSLFGAPKYIYSQFIIPSELQPESPIVTC